MYFVNWPTVVGGYSGMGPRCDAALCSPPPPPPRGLFSEE